MLAIVLMAVTGQNVDVLRTIALTSAGSKVNAAVKKSNMNNILMQLRKWVELISRRAKVADVNFFHA